MAFRVPSPATRWALFWLVCATLLVVRAGSRPDSRGVILDHLEFGRRLLHGEDVHGPWLSDPDAPIRPLHAPYPPSFGLLTAPFSALAAVAGTRAARVAWALLQVGCLLAIAHTLRRRTSPLEPPGRTTAWHWLWLGTFLLGSRFLLRDTHGGGGNLINLALCLLALDDAERDRPRRAGFWLGLSLATKPTQAILVFVFLALGRLRVVGWTAVVGASLVLATLALQRFDTGPWLRWIEGTWRFSTQTDAFAVPAFEFPPFEWMNQSLRCAVARWCGDVPTDLAARVTLGIAPGLGLDAASCAGITRGLGLGMLGALLATAYCTQKRPAARLPVFAAALALSVLLSPISWKAHHVALLPVIFLLVRDLPRATSILLLVVWALCCLPGGDLVGDDRAEWLNSVYVVTAADLVLFGWALHRAWSAPHEDLQAARTPEIGQVRG